MREYEFSKVFLKIMGDDDSLKHRLVMLEKLDETRAQAHLNMEAIQKHRKSYYDSKLVPKKLEPMI